MLRNLARLPGGFSSPLQAQCVVTRQNQHALEEPVLAPRATRFSWMTFSFYVPWSSETGGHAWRDNEARAEAVREVLRLKRALPGFIRNSTRSLELMLPENAKRVTENCPAKARILPLYLAGDRFTTPFCCYGNDVDCDRCGAWAVFHLAARLESRATPE